MSLVDLPVGCIRVYGGRAVIVMVGELPLTRRMFFDLDEVTFDSVDGSFCRVNDRHADYAWILGFDRESRVLVRGYAGDVFDEGYDVVIEEMYLESLREKQFGTIQPSAEEIRVQNEINDYEREGRAIERARMDATRSLLDSLPWVMLVESPE